MDNEFTLRCNSLPCRQELRQEAVVTTCSHIFCIGCAQKLGLANAESGGRVCPACKSPLNNQDDAVVAQLNPSEDYKTSVLSGLNPGVITECASRGLAFFNYQATQEIVYQEYLYKCMRDQYRKLDDEYEATILKANSKVEKLTDQISAMTIQNHQLQEKCKVVEEQFKEKNRHHVKYKKMYESLKQKALLGDIAGAASLATEQALHDSGHQHAEDPRRPRGLQQTHGRTGSGISGVNRINPNAYQNPQPNSHNGTFAPQHIPTPARQHMSMQQGGVPMQSSQMGVNQLGGDHSRRGTPHRGPLSNLDANIQSNGNGGMSAGYKAGRQQSGPFGRSEHQLPHQNRYGSLNVR
ncbi:hypothetical protein MBLNU230_g1650t1 [Neophaeotheca triangularis]